jgi:hypothetical protein
LSIIVPAIPVIPYFPRLFTIDNTQKIWAIPATRKNIAVFTLKPIIFGTNKRCNIPAIAVVPAC